jgi:hypothetical protein
MVRKNINDPQKCGIRTSALNLFSIESSSVSIWVHCRFPTGLLCYTRFSAHQHLFLSGIHVNAKTGSGVRFKRHISVDLHRRQVLCRLTLSVMHKTARIKSTLAFSPVAPFPMSGFKSQLCLRHFKLVPSCYS